MWEMDEYENSLQYFDKSLDLDEKYLTALCNKTLTLLILNRCSDALYNSEKCIKIKPKDLKGWILKCNAYDCLKEYEKAIKIYDEALEINPKFAEAISGKALCLFKLEKYDDALKYCDEAIKSKPSYKFTWHIKGYVLEKLGKHDEAMECYEKVPAFFKKLKPLNLKLNLQLLCNTMKDENEPEIAANWYIKGVILKYLGNDSEALYSLNKALKLDSEFKPALKFKSNFHLSKI